MTAVAADARMLSSVSHPAASAVARLRASPYPAVRSVACEYVNGDLVLHGRLPTFFLKQVAQTTVRGLEGVARIVNQIEVADGAAWRGRRCPLPRAAEFLKRATCQVAVGEATCMP